MYTPHDKCIECLEHWLLYVDAGLSPATAGFFAGLFHVVNGVGPAYQFGKLARLHLMRRYEEAMDAAFDAMLREQ